MRKQGVYAMSQLTQYIIALSNLYGMVHKDNANAKLKVYQL